MVYCNRPSNTYIKRESEKQNKEAAAQCWKRGMRSGGVGLKYKSSLPHDKEQTCVKNKLKKKEPLPPDERICALPEEIGPICMR